MISGPQENFDQLGRREEAVRPESPRDHNIENERELEEFAQDRGNNLELEAENLESDGKKKVENANDGIGLSEEKVKEAKLAFGLQDRLGGLYEKGKMLALAGKEKIGQVVKSKEFGEIADATPFVSGAKKVVESVIGKTLSGEELKGKQRISHGIKGGVDLGLDVSEVGQVKKGARLAHIGKKLTQGVEQNPELGVKFVKKILSKNKNGGASPK